jgi:hypothetical protein
MVVAKERFDRRAVRQRFFGVAHHDQPLASTSVVLIEV